MGELKKHYNETLDSLKEVIENFKQLEELSLTLDWDKKKELDTIIQNCYTEIEKIIKNFEKAYQNNLFLY